MHKLTKYALLLLIIGGAGVYLYWAKQRPDVGIFLTDLRSQLSVNQGQPSERGNLLGIQPLLYASDYQSRETLHLKLAAYLQKARDKGLLNSKTVAVLPEHIGTWLVASGEKPEFYQSDSLVEAIGWLTASHPLAIPKALMETPGDKEFSDALFRLKAKQMAKDYQQLFGTLAKEFSITLVAGSIVLPEPHVESGQLKIDDGPLYNISVVFGADGSIIGPAQRKVHLSSRERRFIAAAPLEQLHAIDTPAGKLGVLIGTDSWYPDSYAALAKLDIKLLAIPAFIKGKNQWEKPWRGNKGAQEPAFIALKEAQSTEANAWQQLAIPNQLKASGAEAGALVFSRGQLWRMSIDGRSIASDSREHALAGDALGAHLINIWL
ncbi:MAG: carbon-nitrogen hydrolase family protein [Pseudomonas marincola]|jgi:hypothetical protein|uniref:carbon-nitrogen hydrolase family protein n=1 Tax=Pseudomonas marincola TaxID=437900 RepID=UPI00300133F9